MDYWRLVTSAGRRVRGIGGDELSNVTYPIRGELAYCSIIK